MALNTQQFTIGTTSIQIFSPSANSRQVILHNANKSSNTFIWFGGSSDVTTTSGAHIDDASTYQLVLQGGNSLWAISDSAGRALHVLWQEL
jgi:hypothetical protein